MENRNQRRLAAIVVADVVGYSRLMERDEAGTLAAIKRRQLEIVEPVVGAHGGRIVKLLGDGVLMEFASAVNAVKAALELLAKFALANEALPDNRRIELRIGINLGDVIGEGSDIYGDGVNIAARLETLAEPGGVCISGKIQAEIEGKIEVQFTDMGEQKLKNIEKPVRTFQLRRQVAQLMEHGSGSTPGPASIAVLPFTNMSSDPEQEYFADGLSEDLITDLSKVAGLFVIARHSSFAYKGKSIDIRQAARELGVSYVVEGSVRRSASRVRITVQLIDARDGSHVWADRFDRDLAEFFSLQDEVLGKIVNALADALPSARVPPKRRAPDLAAYDLFVRGRVLSMQSPESNLVARPLLERACDLDPGFAEAPAWLAMNLHFGWMYCYQEDMRDKVQALALKAVALDPANADARVALGYVLIFNGEGDLAGGREQFETALKLNQNHADAWLFMADLEVLEGNSDEAVRRGRMAFTLNPFPPEYFYWLFSWALYSAGHYGEIVTMLSSVNTRGTNSQRMLAGALAQLGRLDEAREEARQFMAAVPQFTISSWIKSLPARDPRSLLPFVDGYRKAGLPH